MAHTKKDAIQPLEILPESGSLTRNIQPERPIKKTKSSKSCFRKTQFWTSGQGISDGLGVHCTRCVVDDRHYAISTNFPNMDGIHQFWNEELEI